MEHMEYLYISYIYNYLDLFNLIVYGFYQGKSPWKAIISRNMFFPKNPFVCPKEGITPTFLF